MVSTVSTAGHQTDVIKAHPDCPYSERDGKSHSLEQLRIESKRPLAHRMHRSGFE